ncbi:hypothetical protein ACHAQJ_008040 [Trichoderma viride]
MAEVNPPAKYTCTAHIRAPPSLTSHIDIVNRATAPCQNENPTYGALISFDFRCPSDLFHDQKELVAKFNLNFTTQDESHTPIEIQDAQVGHFTFDNNIAELINESKIGSPFEIIRPFKNGTAEITMRQLDGYSKGGYNNVRIIVLLNAYPSNIDVSVSLSTEDGINRLSRAFTGAGRPYSASSPDEEKLQNLLCWTAGLGYGKLFEAYLDQAPRGLDTEDAFGMTPFSWAALGGHTSVIHLALQHAGSISARSRTILGPAPLEAAARSKDENIFNSFLKCLKYFENLKDGIPETDEIPTPNEMKELENSDIEQEIDIAVRREQAVTVRKLVEMLRDRQGDEKAWLTDEIRKASEKGVFYHVQALRSCGAEVNYSDGTNINSPSLMSAINNNRTKVAEYLIFEGATDKKALCTAVKNKQHNTIRALLQVGALVEEDKVKLLEMATREKDSTTLMLLKVEKSTGRLATSEDLHPKVDGLFEATVVDFPKDQTPKFDELSVADLMQKPEAFFDLTDTTAFKWFHLPANNMKWAEALIRKIYQRDPSMAYKVLEPKRWVKRQHEGEKDSPHARFMMPACHDFSEAFKDNKEVAYDKKDKHVVLFMPYLHWDEEVAMQNRSEFLANPPPDASTSTNEPGNQTPITKKEDMLLRSYLLSEINCDKNSRHVLHIRRTLDQSLYHNLNDTKVRDADQTVHRYQKKLKDKKPNESHDPFTAIMVDQLWLWILLGPSGKAQAIVTCFPSRSWHDVDKESGPNLQQNPQQNPRQDSQGCKSLDQRRATDVVQTTKSYIQQRPDAVKTPYDLAGVIASRCSRALLDHSADMLNFAEVYANSISDIMNEEILLFDTFNRLMQTRTRTIHRLRREGRQKENEESIEADSYLANEIMEKIESLETLKEDALIFKDFEKRCQQYRKYTLDTEIPNESEIKDLGKKCNKEKKKHHLIRLLEKFGRLYVLDITREIALLRQIKDIQDELEMMEKVFADQKEVLEAMDRIIRLMVQTKLNPDDGMQTGSTDTKWNSRRVSNGSKAERDYSENRQHSFKNYRHHKRIESTVIYDSDSTLGDEHSLANESQYYSGKGTSRKRDYLKQTPSMIWEFRHQKQNLPLRTVFRLLEQVKKMNERARNTNSALNTLVDLKQKQNNMIDTRTARLQAEQSHKMALEAEAQGKALMVFTIVTIVFLPLSFIAAFFAIPTKEFGTGNLTLDFVSKITFPVSAATSFLFIAIGFATSNWRRLADKISSKIRSDSGKKSHPVVEDKSDQKQIKSNAQVNNESLSQPEGAILRKNDSLV